jgi:phosphatidylserine/phosphatidylglycerophosphate/cardiolipin synthase-like enzyme
MTSNKICDPLPIYCTWSHRELLPPGLQGRFRDLDQFLRDLVVSAEASVLLVAPYLSSLGMQALRGSLAAAAQRGVWIRLVTDASATSRKRNSEAINTLVADNEGRLVRPRLRVLSASSRLPVLFHAKFAVIDGIRGYLGSANLSFAGFEQNFEIGTGLAREQAEALDSLVSYLESINLVTDDTAHWLASTPRTASI